MCIKYFFNKILQASVVMGVKVHFSFPYFRVSKNNIKQKKISQNLINIFFKKFKKNLKISLLLL